MRKLSRQEHIANFWSKVDKNGPNGCWIWTAGKGAANYGAAALGGIFEGQYFAHRISYGLAHDGIPKGMDILHKCDNPPCVNPEHLFLGTQRDNNLDMIAKKRNKIPPSGSSHPRAKLTWAKAGVIRLSDEPYKILAERFGISISLIEKVRAKECWI